MSRYIYSNITIYNQYNKMSYLSIGMLNIFHYPDVSLSNLLSSSLSSVFLPLIHVYLYPKYIHKFHIFVCMSIFCRSTMFTISINWQTVMCNVAMFSYLYLVNNPAPIQNVVGLIQSLVAKTQTLRMAQQIPFFSYADLHTRDYASNLLQLKRSVTLFCFLICQ